MIRSLFQPLVDERKVLGSHQHPPRSVLAQASSLKPLWIQHIGDRGVRTVADAEGYLRSGPLASYAEHGHGLYRVAPRDTGEPVGRRIFIGPALTVGAAGVANFWQNFGKMLLVFGCIGTDFCK